MTLAELLRPGLGALDARSCCAGSEDQGIPVAETIREPGDERNLWPDDGEIDPLVLNGGDEGFDIVGRDREQGRDLSDARIARRGQHLVDDGAPRQPARDRVLAASSADDQDPHSGRLCSRDGPMETTPTFTPPRSWIRSTYLRAGAGRSSTVFASASSSGQPSISS